ncbi:MAG: hypothetical protein WA633_01030 [Stellaceae bacterium]|jgi:hypothetical protein
MKRLVIALGAVLMVAAVSAHATQQGQSALHSWKAMDNCAKQAQAAYPEFNAESNAKRDAKLKECLSGSGLPPREPLTQPGSR